MARKGRKRSIQVWGVVLENGNEVNAGDDGIVSVFAAGNKEVIVTDDKATKTTLLNSDGEPEKWVSYLPRFN